MAREVDERKKRAALRKLHRAAELAKQGLGPPLSDWEAAFLEEVEGRIEKFGSAFSDPMKGSDGEALSGLQQAKLREIDKKARGKASKGLKARKPMGAKDRPPHPQPEIETGDTPQPEPAPAPPRTRPALVPVEGLTNAGNVTPLRRTKPRLTVIEGGGQKPGN